MNFHLHVGGCFKLYGDDDEHLLTATSHIKPHIPTFPMRHMFSQQVSYCLICHPSHHTLKIVLGVTVPMSTLIYIYYEYCCLVNNILTVLYWLFQSIYGQLYIEWIIQPSRPKPSYGLRYYNSLQADMNLINILSTYISLSMNCRQLAKCVANVAVIFLSLY